MKLARGRIEVLDDDAVQPPRLPRFLDVQFNPTEYTLQKGAQIAEIGVYGIDSPILQFVRGQNEKLNLELFFDTTTGLTGEEMDANMGPNAVPVTTLTQPFYQLVKIQPRTHAPPRIRFTWGQGLSFKAIVESVQQKFSLFSQAGVPLRATLTLSFREYKTLEEQVAQLNLQSADQSRRRLVQAGDTLSRIAAEEYHNPAAWRVIADANRIDNPRNLVPGAELILPALDPFGQPISGKR